MNLKMILISAAVLATVAEGDVAMNSCTSIGKSATGVRLEAMKASPNWRDGKFVNLLASIEPKFFEALGKWIRGADNTVPNTLLPVVERIASDFDISPEGGLRITWFGHSTLLVEIDGHRLLVDPVWSERPSPFSWMGPKRFHKTPLTIDELPAIDVVVISHDHFDHLDQYTIQALGKCAPLYVVPLGVGAHLEHWGVPSDRIIERDWWGNVKLGDLTLTATPARHFSGRSLVMADKSETLWSGWVITGPEHRIYYSGDTGMFPDFVAIGERLGPFDAVLIEIGAYDQLWADLHIGPEQAIEARLAIGSGLFIPVHWGTFDLAMHAWTEPVERVLVAAEKVGVQVVVPQPGESIEPANPPEITRWWPERPWQTAEEVPVVSSGLVQSQNIRQKSAEVQQVLSRIDRK
jgi:L-ascorbate metabolism protein UlaG (beta-lactamase superfamily)